jgi:hypothetical protein
MGRYRYSLSRYLDLAVIEMELCCGPENSKVCPKEKECQKIFDVRLCDGCVYPRKDDYQQWHGKFTELRRNGD